MKQLISQAKVDQIKIQQPFQISVFRHWKLPFTPGIPQFSQGREKNPIGEFGVMREFDFAT